jgi:hypothetical protein
MQNANDDFEKDEVLETIAKQAPQLLKFLPKQLDSWLSKSQLQALVEAEADTEVSKVDQQAAVLAKYALEEDQRVYVFIKGEKIDLGFQEPNPFKEKVTFDEVFELLQVRAVGYDTNLQEKEYSHAAMLRLSLINPRQMQRNQPLKNLTIANQLGLDK